MSHCLSAEATDGELHRQRDELHGKTIAEGEGRGEVALVTARTLDNGTGAVSALYIIQRSMSLHRQLGVNRTRRFVQINNAWREDVREIPDESNDFLCREALKKPLFVSASLCPLR